MALDRKLDEHLAFARKSTVREYTESIAVAVLIALFLRAFVVEAFKIPSGSMIPTLQVGDHIFVNKFIYGIRPPWPWEEMEFGREHPKFFMGLRKPERGEVIVFKYPKDPDKDFIKRIVAIEGDTVEIRQNLVYVNGQPVQHLPADGNPCEYEDYDEARGQWEHRLCEGFRDTLDGRTFSTILDQNSVGRSWPPVTVAAGNVFVMGDNRDNSHDSRYWGTVPFELIKGKAMIVWWSAGEPEGIRVRRMGRLVE
ncbi:MAG: signal peptidase I [Myxococcales bacterium]|nr:signal peptidase I [Myxococcales bacterium]